MLRLLRPFLALSPLIALWPTFAAGQAVKAGVVTTLQGTATAARVGAPPVPLKFKDDVFVQDRVITGEQSIARILLGGRAVVTVRERSVLTITEVPGRSTINLESGKIGVAVARDRMRPGETLDVRTANAIAAVRGTVLVAEGEGTGAAARSEFTVVSDRVNRGVEVSSLDPGTGARVGTPLLLGERDNLTALGAQRPAVVALTPVQVQAKTAGLQPTSPQHSPGNEGTIAPGQVEQAAALAGVLNGDFGQPTSFVPSSGGFPVPTLPLIPEVQPQANGGTPGPIFGPVDITSPPLSPPCAGSNCNLLSNGGFETGSFAPGWTLAGAGAVIGTFGTTTTLPPLEGAFQAILHTGPGSVPVVGCGSGNPCERSTLSQSINVSSVLFVKLSGYILSNEFPTFTGPGSEFKDRIRLTITDSEATVHTVFDIDVTALHNEFVASSTTESAGGFTLGVGGGITDAGTVSRTVVTANGPALVEITVEDVSDGSFDTAALLDALVVQDPPLYFLRDGAKLTRSGPEPLLRVVREDRTFDSLLIVCCHSAATVAGPLLHATDSTLDVPFSLVSLLSGGSLVSSSTGPLVLLEGGDYRLGSFAGIFDVAGVRPLDQPLRHGGSLLETSGATVTTESVVRLDTALLEASRPLISLKAGSHLTTTASAVDLSYRARVTSLGPVTQLDRSAMTVVRGAAVALAGGSALNVTGDLVRLANGSVLRILDGSLLSVRGGSMANISGALVGFGGEGGNRISIANTLCSPCSLIGGLPVALTGGALASNVSIGPGAIRNSGLGSITLANPTLAPGGTAVIHVSGPTSTVTVGGR